LMAAASCLVAPSLAPETSSITARESLAAGTPVVAFQRGALAEIIDPGRTGVLVDHMDQLPDAIRAAVSLSSEDCRHVAESRFSADRMIAAYMAAYQSLVDHRALPMLDAAEAR
jgi:glycosyltransferase involved in cell wall biosynthesis